MTNSGEGYAFGNKTNNLISITPFSRHDFVLYFNSAQSCVGLKKIQFVLQE
jgi:hypothetical protein